METRPSGLAETQAVELRGECSDGVVGIGDLLLLLGNWGPVKGSDRRADMDNDGVVGIGDLLALLAAWS